MGRPNRHPRSTTGRTLRGGAGIVFTALLVWAPLNFGSARQGGIRILCWTCVVATLLWLIASTLFSYYVGHIASYDATYGPLGAVAGIMIWFWVSAYVVLLGAELNAELQEQSAPGANSATLS